MGKMIYVCTECGGQHLQWLGQCRHCQAYSTLSEEVIESVKSTKKRQDDSKPVLLNAIDAGEMPRMDTTCSELNRVLGGGLVPGSVVLLGGDPGIGKSTLLLQTLARMTEQHAVLYVSGEESLQQVHMRAQYAGLSDTPMPLLAQTLLESIMAHAKALKPKIMVLDSIQTIHSEGLPAIPGSVSQVRHVTMRLVEYAKKNEVAVFLVGHVTKEGTIAGPRLLEHMVDTVLYFEGERSGRLRLVRSVKNRFGAAHELGVFAMTDQGLTAVRNPSRLFLSGSDRRTSGSVVMATWEGSRPLLVELQALLDDAKMPQPRRLSVGLDPQRLSMLLAILHRHGGLMVQHQDVFVNVVGGLKIAETASDVPIVLAIVSSLKGLIIDRDCLVFGELGLGGEVRPVQGGIERLQEGAKQGFTKALVPKANMPKKPIKGMTVYAVSTLSEVLSFVRDRIHLVSDN
jgi:DNA repair protein RadA/Sms